MAQPQAKDDVIIEEEGGVFKRTIEQVTPRTSAKRPRDEQVPAESPSKFQHTTGGTRFAAATKQESLPVPFWKKLNHRHPAFQTREVGHFSLLNRDDDKECFDDKRYLRGNRAPSEFASELQLLVSSVHIPASNTERQF